MVVKNQKVEIERQVQLPPVRGVSFSLVDAKLKFNIDCAIMLSCVKQKRSFTKWVKEFGWASSF